MEYGLFRRIRLGTFVLTIALHTAACSEIKLDVTGCIGPDGQITHLDKNCSEKSVSALSIDEPSDAQRTSLNAGQKAFESGKYNQAYVQLKPLADQGVAMAQNTLGRMYLQGQGVSKDPIEALTLFRKAASQGLPNAQSNLGVMYASGQGVPQDYKQSVELFRKAANQGFKIAMSNLADMYENGLGVNPDQAEADRWRKKSQGLEPVQVRDQVQVETVGAQKYAQGLDAYYRFDFVRAAELLLQAARQGHPEAQLKLAWMYQHGQGVQEDEAQAQYWAQMAGAEGHSMDDDRDRVLLIDPSAAGSIVMPAQEHGPMACGCPEDTPFGKCKSSVSAQGGCSCAVEK